MFRAFFKPRLGGYNSEMEMQHTNWTYNLKCSILGRIWLFRCVGEDKILDSISIMQFQTIYRNITQNSGINSKFPT